jgi:hypothetical protein
MRTLFHATFGIEKLQRKARFFYFFFSFFGGSHFHNFMLCMCHAHNHTHIQHIYVFFFFTLLLFHIHSTSQHSDVSHTTVPAPNRVINFAFFIFICLCVMWGCIGVLGVWGVNMRIYVDVDGCVLTHWLRLIANWSAVRGKIQFSIFNLKITKIHWESTRKL